MDAFTDLTQGFLSMFETGGEILLGWMTTILPMVVCLMTAVSAVVKLIGESRVERITKFLTRWRIVRYTLLPLMAILFLGNPLCFTFGKFLDEKYKTAYYDACVSFLHPVTGLFPHANAAELFVYMGIASGITQQKLSLSALATRYFMAGLVIMVLRGIITEQISVYLNQKKEGQKPTEEAVAEEKKDALKQQQAVRVTKGSAGWGGPLLLQADKRKHVILCVSGGGIHPIAQRLAEACQCDVIDGFAASCPDEEILAAVIDCGGTARCGIYPKKGIPTINVLPTGQSGPLARFMKEDNYVSDVGEANIEILNKDTAPTTDPMQEPESKISAQPASHKNALLRVGMGMSRVVSTCYAAGKETIEMVLRNILPFMAFTATLLGMIQVSGLGNFIANSIAPLCATLPGMLLISLICSLPVVSPILGPGAVIAQVVGALLGTQIALGNIPAQYALPALFAINAQAGCDFIPVGLSLCQAKAETVEAGVPAVLYSRMISGPLAVFIAYFFNIGMY